MLIVQPTTIISMLFSTTIIFLIVSLICLAADMVNERLVSAFAGIDLS